MLFATTPFAVDMHFCCNILVDQSMFSKSKTCGMEVNETPPKQCSIEDNDNCCSTKSFTKKVVDNLNIVSIDLENDLETIVFLSSFLYSYIDLFEGLEKNIVPFEKYSPPLLSEDIQILNETYLI